MPAPVGVAWGGPALPTPSGPATPSAWAASRYYLAARLRADQLIPAGPGGYVPDEAALTTLAAMAATSAPDLALAALLAGEAPPWPTGNLGVQGHPCVPAAFLLADAAARADLPPDGLRLRDHPITDAPLPRPVRIDVLGNLTALPRAARDDVLDALEPTLAGVPDKLARAVQRYTRRVLGDPALFDPTEKPDPAVLALYAAALAAVPTFDPKKPGPWQRAVERAWPTALGLPLTVAAIVARFRARGEALGIGKADLAAGCRTLRSRPLRPNDHGAVARWIAGLVKLKDAAAWTRYARLGWGRARQASVTAYDRARRKGCGRQTHGSEGGQRRRCGTHGCGHADCAPRQAALAGEQSWAHARAWEDAGVAHVRIGLTLPVRNWTPVEAMDALDPCAAPFVRALARSLGCRIAARIAVERQADGTPEWVFILADVEGELTRRMLVEDAAYMACNQYDPPPLTPDLLAARTRVVTNAGIRTADLWPDLTREVQAAADAAVAKAGTAWEATYIAPVFNLDGTWGDVHKAAQATGHDWPEGFRRFRSSRGGSKDGLVLPYAAAWTAAGSAPTSRREGQEQRRAAENRADAAEAARTLSEAPTFPMGQGEARDAAKEARTLANDSAAEADRSAAAAYAAHEAANNADAWANEYAARARAAARANDDAKTTLGRLRKSADRAERRAVRARAHVATLVREHAIERAEVRATVAEAEAEAQAQAVADADLAAVQAQGGADDAAAQARAAADAADAARRDAHEAHIDAALDEMTADRDERRARRLEQIAQAAPARAALAAKRARSAALLDGPLPVGRPAKLTGRWSPCRPMPDPDEDEDDEKLLTPSWTLTDNVAWLRKVGPAGMKILGRVAMDGEIASYRLVMPPPPVTTFVLDLSAITLGENPDSRLDCVRERLRRGSPLGPARPLGLPRDLAPHADPAWTPMPPDRPLTDAEIDEVLRRYVVAAVRRASTTTGALDSAGLPVADAAAWTAAGVARQLLPGPTA